jgi:hypothetical protein
LCEKKLNESLPVVTDRRTDTISACRLSTLPRERIMSSLIDSEKAVYGLPSDGGKRRRKLGTAERSTAHRKNKILDRSRSWNFENLNMNPVLNSSADDSTME